MTGHAIVTGAASERGIGRATVERLVADGWQVGLLDLDEPGLHRAAVRLEEAGNAPGLWAACDVGSEASVQAAVAELLERLGTCEALVNLAGITSPTPVVDLSLAEWERIFAVNSTGTFLVTRAVLPTMVANRYGRIVNMSSVSAIRGGGVFGGAHYSAAKAAVLGFTRAVARELAPLGITCNAVAPGLIDTDLAAPHLSAEQRRAVLAGIPAGRLGTPADVAAVIRFLCSEESGYVTGEVVDINGGSHID